MQVPCRGTYCLRTIFVWKGPKGKFFWETSKEKGRPGKLTAVMGHSAWQDNVPQSFNWKAVLLEIFVDGVALMDPSLARARL